MILTTCMILGLFAGYDLNRSDDLRDVILTAPQRASLLVKIESTVKNDRWNPTVRSIHSFESVLPDGSPDVLVADVTYEPHVSESDFRYWNEASCTWEVGRENGWGWCQLTEHTAIRMEEPGYWVRVWPASDAVRPEARAALASLLEVTEIPLLEGMLPNQPREYRVDAISIRGTEIQVNVTLRDGKGLIAYFEHGSQIAFENAVGWQPIKAECRDVPDIPEDTWAFECR